MTETVKPAETEARPLADVELDEAAGGLNFTNVANKIVDVGVRLGDGSVRPVSKINAGDGSV